MDISMNPLTHVDVEQQTFHASFRGYAEDEVDQFLDEIVVSLRTLHQMVADRDKQIVSLTKGGDGETDHAVSGVSIDAQRSSDRIVIEARKEAESVAAGKAASSVEEATLPEISAAVEQVESRFTGVRLSDVMMSIEEPPPAVDETPMTADDGGVDEPHNPYRQPGERG